MAERTNAYVESTGRSTTTSLAPVNKARLTHTPGSSEKWAYFADVTLDKSATTNDVRSRLRNSTAAADWGEVAIEPQDTTNRINTCWFKVYTYGVTPGSQNIDVDYWCEASGTAGAADAHIWGLLIGSADKSAEDSTTKNYTSSTFATALTLTDTFPANCLIFAMCEYSVADSTTATIGIRADMGGTKHGEMRASVQDISTFRTWSTIWKRTGLSGSQTVTIEVASTNNVATCQVRTLRILALSLDVFANNYSVEDPTRTTNSTSTPQDQSSLNFTPAATRNHIAFGGGIGDHNNITTNGFLEFERGGTAICQHQEEPNTANDEYAVISLQRASLSASTTYKVQFWSETTNTTGCAQAGVWAIDLEEAPVASTGLGPLLGGMRNYLVGGGMVAA